MFWIGIVLVSIRIRSSVLTRTISYVQKADSISDQDLIKPNVPDIDMTGLRIYFFMAHFGQGVLDLQKKFFIVADVLRFSMLIRIRLSTLLPTRIWTLPLARPSE
jgi:hypothetical protein